MMQCAEESEVTVDQTRHHPRRCSDSGRFLLPPTSPLSRCSSRTSRSTVEVATAAAAVVAMVIAQWVRGRGLSPNGAMISSNFRRRPRRACPTSTPRRSTPRRRNFNHASCSGPHLTLSATTRRQRRRCVTTSIRSSPADFTSTFDNRSHQPRRQPAGLGNSPSPSRARTLLPPSAPGLSIYLRRSTNHPVTITRTAHWSVRTVTWRDS